MVLKTPLHCTRRLLLALSPWLFLLPAAGQTIELSTTETLSYVGYTTNPLTVPNGLDPVSTRAAVLPAELREKLAVAADDWVLVLDPQDTGFFWFKGDVEYDALTLAVSDENGWYGYGRAGGSVGGNLLYSFDNMPAKSRKYKLHAFRGKRWDSETALTTFNAWESTAPVAAPAFEAAKTEFPIRIESNGYRLTVHRIVSGFTSLERDRKKPRTKDFYLKQEWPKASIPDSPYTGIVYELEKPASSSTVSGRLDHLLGDGYVHAYEGWEKHTSVKDAGGTTWSTNFSGPGSGTGGISFRETRLNLPANQGPFNFDVYLTRKTKAGPDLTLPGLIVPEKGKALDSVTTTVKGKQLTVGMVGSMTDVPSEFSFGQFESPSVLVSSPNPLPGLVVRVSNGAGTVDSSDRWDQPTADELHYIIVPFSGNKEVGDSFRAGTTVSVELILPETLHFPFNAIPERVN